MRSGSGGVRYWFMIAVDTRYLAVSVLLPTLVTGAGLAFALVRRRSLGRTATILMVIGCGALLAAFQLSLISVELSPRRSTALVREYFALMPRLLGVAGLAAIMLAVFVRRPVGDDDET
jgi:hypothetical protein